MKRAASFQNACRGLMAAWLVLAANARAQIEVIPSVILSAVVGGSAHELNVLLRNSAERASETSLSTRLHQLSSATQMPAGPAEPWKKVTVPGGQTVLEKIVVTFPGVRATTKFEVRWLDESGRLVGRVPVMVYPTNLLQQFGDISDGKPPGIFDPHEQLTPLLHRLGVEFDDLRTGERLATWRGRLAVLGPFDAKQPPPRDLLKQAAALAARGAGVLMFAPENETTNSMIFTPAALPQVVMIRTVGDQRLVTAPSKMVAGLAMEPLAQEKLIELARLAVAVDLPKTEVQP